MIEGPWYISKAAVQDYLQIIGKPWADDGPDFDAAEIALVEIARSIVAAGKEGTPQDSGALQYRGPRPLRLRLTVAPEARKEGSKPQLMRVRPDHEGRAGAYTRSAPGRKHGGGR